METTIESALRGVGQFEGISFESPPAILHVKILSGSDLYKTDAFHKKIDPYVEVALGCDSSRSITRLRGGSNCFFNWSVTFPFNPAKKLHDALVVTVWDQDLLTKNDEVGRCVLPINRFKACESKERAFSGKLKLVHIGRLSGREKDGGFVDIEVYWEKNFIFLETTNSQKNVFETPSGVVAVPLPLNFCVTNFNTMPGIAQAIVDKGKLSEYSPFRTYSLRLWHIPFVFQGYTKGWNRNYKAAQQIYGNHLSCKAMRAALRIQNFIAYSNDHHTNNSAHVHEISGMKTLYEMLRSYDTASRTDRVSSPRYTYVIMPDSHMHFSITSKNVATDFLSKHALHAGASTEVVYSGEFFFDQYSCQAKATGKIGLVIDNNSGTFAPPKDKLDLLKLLMHLNFGTVMPIFALDREDPLLKKLSDANGVE
mmetsp:Transcript_36830/g.78532  ORF Transcript_36830/g.78532 Transcript_36830/m.78532 type:complete len:424 (+) Transcript_36830:96-1367(+)